MKRSLVYILFFIISIHGINAQFKYCPYGGHPEDSAIVPSHRGFKDGSNTLNQSYLRQNVCGLNYVEVDTLVETRTTSFGFDTNGTGLPSTMNLKGATIGL